MRSTAVILAALTGVAVTSPLTAQESPATVYSACKASAGSEAELPADNTYPGGLSARGGALTPSTAPGATTVSARVAKCMTDRLGGRLVIIAAMRDTIGIPGAHRFAAAGEGGTLNDYRQEFVARDLDYLTDGDRTRPILVYCHHESCFLSYNAVLRAAHAGYRNIYWLRAGIRGWTGAGYSIATPLEKSGLPLDRKLPVMTSLPSVTRDLRYPVPVNRPLRESESLPLRRLCHDIADGTEAREDSRALYKFEETMWLAAGVDTLRDGPAATRRKVQAYMQRLEPSLLGENTCWHQGPLISYVYQKFPKGLSTFVEEWRLPVNAVDGRGQTVLDVVAAEHARGREDQTHYYSLLRRAGAKHRSELEAEGKWPTARQLAAKYLPEYITASEAGNVRAMWELSWLYGRGTYMPANIPLAQSWIRRAGQRAIEVGDWGSAVWIGVGYLQDRESWMPAETATGYDLIRRGAEAGNPDGMFWMAKAYENGLHVQRDVARAHDMYAGVYRKLGLAVNGQLAIIAAGRTAEKLGRLDDAAKWYRMMGDLTPIGDGRLVGHFFDQHKISMCGPKIDGTKRTNC